MGLHTQRTIVRSLWPAIVHIVGLREQLVTLLHQLIQAVYSKVSG